MGLTSRQIEILHKILNERRIEDIAKSLEISNKTIDLEISQIVKFFKSKGLKVEKNRVNPILVDDASKEKFYQILYKEIKKDVFSLPSSQFERQIYILGRLIFNLQISIFDIAEELCVSNSTVYRDCVNLKKTLSLYLPHDAVTISKGDINIWINKRELQSFVFDVLTGNVFRNNVSNLKLINFIFDGNLKIKKFNNVVNIIREYCIETSMIISEEKIISCASLIYFSYLIDTDKIDIDQKRDNTSIVHPLVNRIRKSDKDFVLDEYSLEMVSNYYVLILHNQEEDDVLKKSSEILKQFYDTVYDLYGLNLAVFEDINTILQMHISQLILRIKNNFEEVCELDHIDIQFPQSYQIANTMVPVIFKNYDRIINSYEVYLISLYVEMVIRKLRGKIRVVLVTDSTRSINEYLRHWIEDNFSDDLVIDSVVSRYSLSAYLNKNPDVKFVISTVFIEYATDRCVIIINKIPNMVDKDKINQYLVSKKKIDLMENDELFVSKKNIFIKECKGLTFSSLVEEMTENLSEFGIIKNKKEFVTSILDREKVYSTLISKQVLMPHSINVLSEKNSVSVAVLKEGLEIHDSLVRVVFLLALDGTYDQKYIRQLSVIKKIAFDNDFIEKIVECNNSTEVSKLLQKYMLERKL